MQLLLHCHTLLSLAATRFVLLLQRMAQIRKLVKDSSLKEAQDRASQLVLQYPIEAKIHSDLGGIMYEMGDYESAVTSLLTLSCLHLVCPSVSLVCDQETHCTALYLIKKLTVKDLASCSIKSCICQICLCQQHKCASSVLSVQMITLQS